MHAAIDLDALGLAYLPSESRNDGVMYNNLVSVYKNYAALGVQRFLVARAIEDDVQNWDSPALHFQPQTRSFAVSPRAWK